jgi:magnesium-transporting ATPase (P-type)
MSLLLYGGTFLGVGALLAVGGVYTVMAAEQLTKSSDYKSDDNLKNAHKSLSISSSLAWCGIALIIVIIILYIAFGIETIEYTGQWLVIILMIFIMALSLSVGVFAVKGATEIKKSTSTTSQKQTAYKDAIIASVLTIGALGLIVIGGITIITIQQISANRRRQQELELQTEIYRRALRTQDLELQARLQAIRTGQVTPNIPTTQLQPNIAQSNVTQSTTTRASTAQTIVNALQASRSSG